VANKKAVQKKGAVKHRLSQQKPTIYVGKGGASIELLKEIERQLKKDEMVKVRILKSAFAHEELEQIAAKIAQQAEAYLIEVRGHTFILYKHDAK